MDRNKRGENTRFKRDRTRRHPHEAHDGRCDLAAAAGVWAVSGDPVCGRLFVQFGRRAAEERGSLAACRAAAGDIANSVAWETRLGVWRELSPRLGVMIAGRYLHTRPQFTFVNGTQHVWKADRVTIEAGLAFTVIVTERSNAAIEERLKSGHAVGYVSIA